MSVGFAKQGGGLVRLAQLEMRLREEIANLAEPVSRCAEVLQPLAERDRLFMAALGNLSLQVDQPGLCLVVVPALVSQEELDELACLPSNVLQRRKGGTGAARLDQVDPR